MKKKLELEERARDIPSFRAKKIVEFILYCRNLKFSEDPNYEFLRQILIE